MSRIVLRIALGMLVVLVASALVMRWSFRSARHKHIMQTIPALMGQVDLARRLLESAPRAGRAQVLRRLQRTIGHPLKLVDPAGAKLPEGVRQQMQERPEGPFFNFTHGGPQTIYIPLRGEPRLLVMGPTERFNIHEGFPIVQALLMILGVVALVGLGVAAPLVRRVRRLERTAQRISEGDLEARADVSARDAVGSLARRFNVMADRVQALLQSQQELIQAVSHELRTPTARIRFGLELLAGTTGEEDRRQRIASLDEDLTELDALIEELLLYVRMGHQSQRLERQPVQALDEARELVGRLQEQRPEVALQIDASGGDELVASADPRLFRRALLNLLQNALRFARERVTLELRREADRLRVVVCDDGPGVAPGDRQRIFEPFARLDDSRSRESGGSGLGLAIVQRVMQAHGGQVALDEAPEGGARFSLLWPAGDATKR